MSWSIAVDGGWDDWSPWGICSVTCGQGVQQRSRSCGSPAPANGGLECIGAREDIKSCLPMNCAGQYL